MAGCESSPFCRVAIMKNDMTTMVQTARLTLLEHKPAAGRLIELLESKRSDVMIAAAWGLRKVAEPQTVPAVMDKIRRQTDLRKLGSVNPELDEQVAHLFEACGKMQAKEAEPLMMEYVPRDNTRTMDISRSAAIWALGQLHLGTPDPRVADELAGRVMDNGDKPFESPIVKRMAVVALARMKATDQAPALKNSLGLHKQAFLVDEAGAGAVAMMRTLKRALDPKNIMNPGKIFAF